MLIVFKVIYFQSLWYVSTYLGSLSLHFEALGLCLISLGLDYAIFRYKNVKISDYLAFVVALAICGFAFDSLFKWLELLSWREETFYPASLLGIWVMFAAYYPELFSKFDHRPVLRFCLGAIFGPLAYWTGSRIGAINYELDSTPVLVLHGILWGLFFSTSIYIFNLLKLRVLHGNHQCS